MSPLDSSSAALPQPSSLSDIEAYCAWLVTANPWPLQIQSDLDQLPVILNRVFPANDDFNDAAFRLASSLAGSLQAIGRLQGATAVDLICTDASQLLQLAANAPVTLNYDPGSVNWQMVDEAEGPISASAILLDQAAWEERRHRFEADYSEPEIAALKSWQRGFQQILAQAQIEAQYDLDAQGALVSLIGQNRSLAAQLFSFQTRKAAKQQSTAIRQDLATLQRHVIRAAREAVLPPALTAKLQTAVRRLEQVVPSKQVIDLGAGIRRPLPAAGRALSVKSVLPLVRHHPRHRARAAQLGAAQLNPAKATPPVARTSFRITAPLAMGRATPKAVVTAIAPHRTRIARAAASLPAALASKPSSPASRLPTAATVSAAAALPAGTRSKPSSARGAAPVATSAAAAPVTQAPLRATVRPVMHRTAPQPAQPQAAHRQTIRIAVPPRARAPQAGVAPAMPTGTQPRMAGVAAAARAPAQPSPRIQAAPAARMPAAPAVNPALAARAIAQPDTVGHLQANKIATVKPALIARSALAAKPAVVAQAPSPPRAIPAAAQPAPVRQRLATGPATQVVAAKPVATATPSIRYAGQAPSPTAKSAAPARQQPAVTTAATAKSPAPRTVKIATPTRLTAAAATPTASAAKPERSAAPAAKPQTAPAAPAALATPAAPAPKPQDITNKPAGATASSNAAAVASQPDQTASKVATKPVAVPSKLNLSEARLNTGKPLAESVGSHKKNISQPVAPSTAAIQNSSLPDKPVQAKSTPPQQSGKDLPVRKTTRVFAKVCPISGGTCNCGDKPMTLTAAKNIPVEKKAKLTERFEEQHKACTNPDCSICNPGKATAKKLTRKKPAVLNA